MRIITTSIFVFLVFSLMLSVSYGDDLYRIRLSSGAEARFVDSLQVKPVAVLFQGYLVLADAIQADELSTAGIEIEAIKSNVDVNRLVTGFSHEIVDNKSLELVYSEDSYNLYQILESIDKQPLAQPLDLQPLNSDGIIFQYIAPRVFDKNYYQLPQDLEIAMDRISMDSLISYSVVLESFDGRQSNTPQNIAARKWLRGKFQEFGYDSTYYDHFTKGYHYWDGIDCNYGIEVTGANVVAIKPGNKFPNHQIIIGAHFDTYNGWAECMGQPGDMSPGADDNGTGVAAVLEISRVISEIETDLSIIFVMFDGEETVLLGSEHYAFNAWASRQNIQFMLNIDMIGYRGRSNNSVKLYHGDDLFFATMCEHLADSLLGFGVHLLGGRLRSDTYSFKKRGFIANFLHENGNNYLYHSAHDSMIYVDFDYVTDITKIALITVLSADKAVSPGPMLNVEYWGGQPSVFPALESSSITVALEGVNGGLVDPQTAEFNYIIDESEPYTSSLTEESGGIYVVPIPSEAAGSKMKYCVNAEEEQTGQMLCENPGSYKQGYFLYFDEMLFEDNFNEGQDWIIEGDAENGHWERGIPAGDGTHGDPVADYDNSGYCFVTGNNPGESDVDDGTTSLISPSFDLSEYYGEVRYSAWLSNEIDRKDMIFVYASGDDGVSWEIVDTIGDIHNEAIGGWRNYSFIVNKFVGMSPSVRIKFDVSDIWSASNVEAGIDDFKILLYDSDPLEIAEYDLGEWTKHRPYTNKITASGGVGDYFWSEVGNSFTYNGLLLDSTGIITGAPFNNPAVALIAEVEDEGGKTSQKTLHLIVNEPVALKTFELPGGMIHEYYSAQIIATGGTGGLTWSDKYDDLDGTPLTLTETGLLSGLINEPNTFSFTVYIEDTTGSTQEWTYDFNFNYIRGDANGDRMVNVGDAVFLINFVFKGGPAPDPIVLGDAFCDSNVNIGDAVYLINHIFKDGPGPC
ncbi:MAG: M28 family peptidase [candidate division Zixibacteria bacterium]